MNGNNFTIRTGKALFAGIMLLLLSFTAGQQKKKIRVWLIGDSTISVKPSKVFPETGWGMPFAYFFDSTVTVENRAMNGRSTRTFIEEKRWQAVAEALQEGDYVFMQFGHNDEAQNKPERYTSPEDYRKNLIRFISESRDKNANPVLVTPVTRRKFDKEGNILETHIEYSKAVHEVAKAYNVPVIDLDKKSRELLQRFGPEDSKLLFLQLQPGEHPNYPDGKNDNTHFSELGARLIAQLVLAEIKSLDLELAERVVKR